MKIIRYKHHGNTVSVREALKGRHREHCLCWVCQSFNPDDVNVNCLIAREVYSICVKHGLTLPVWECRHFAERTCPNCKYEKLSTFISPCRECKEDVFNLNKNLPPLSKRIDLKTKWEPKE